MAYGFTQSGGKVGTAFIVAITSAFQAFMFSSAKEKATGFLRSFVILSVLLIVLALLNEYVIKPALRIARPVHTYIMDQTHSKTPLDSVYKLSEMSRKDFFRKQLASDTLIFRNIDPRVLQHWVDESGYSFPSGHTFNAFLIGSLLAFSIRRSTFRRIRFLYFIPLVWAMFVAISRVALGAHSPLDVSVGAGMGILISHILLWISATRDLLIPGKAFAGV